LRKKIHHEANRRSRDPYNERTFQFAIKNGRIEVIEWLLENKFPFETKNGTWKI
jgi:hypothetical protein